MSTFIEIVEPLAKLNIPVTPVRPNSKQAFLPNFPATATTDTAQLLAWDVQYPNHNAACVARAEIGGIWVLEIDSANVVERVKAETGQDLNAVQTFRVRSRAGRGHIYFRQTSASIAMGNLNQTYVKGNDWSARVNNMYCVAPGSLHPETGQPYKALNDLQPIEAPQWLIDWLVSQKITASTSNAKPEPTRNAAGKIPHGSIHGWLVSQAGRMRNAGLTVDEIEPALLRLAHEECEEPLDDVKIIQVARSMDNYEPGRAGYALAMGQQPDAGSPAAVQQAIQTMAPAVPPEPEPFKFKRIGYPKFPSWVLRGTSIYEGFVKPCCEVNERIDYFMWAPAAALMLNYLGNKVSIALRNWKPSIYMVLVGDPTHAHKSSSIKDGMIFLEYAGVLAHFGKEIKNANGRSIVWEAGSPEGLGTDMQRIVCKNSVLFYDEFSGLVSKAGIEKSSFKSALLKMYESAKFSNSVKTKKDQFDHAPNSYTASLFTCDTMEEFPAHWSTFANESKGMDKRVSIFLQPESMPARKLETHVSIQGAALETRKLIDKAVAKIVYQFEDQQRFQAMLGKYDGRVQIRAEKWSLYFAVDLNLDVIDEDCVERGVAVAEYEHAVMQYLMLLEATSKLAVIQQNIIRALTNSPGGVLPLHGKRGLNVAIKAHKYDTTELYKAMSGLEKNGNIWVEGKGTAASPKMVRLIRGFDIHDESGDGQ